MSWLLLHLFEDNILPKQNLYFSQLEGTHVLKAPVIFYKLNIEKPNSLIQSQCNTLIICSNQSHKDWLGLFTTIINFLPIAISDSKSQ